MEQSAQSTSESHECVGMPKHGFKTFQMMIANMRAKAGGEILNANNIHWAFGRQNLEFPKKHEYRRDPF